MAAGVPILLVHECSEDLGAVTFDTFFRPEQTPAFLIGWGLYNQLATPLYTQAIPAPLTAFALSRSALASRHLWPDNPRPSPTVFDLSMPKLSTSPASPSDDRRITGSRASQ